MLGATPRLSPVFQLALQDEKIEERVKILRNICDFQDIDELFDSSKSIAVVGGGFLGSELACAMARKGLFLIYFSFNRRDFKYLQIKKMPRIFIKYTVKVEIWVKYYQNI